MFAFGSRESNATTAMETQQKRLYQNEGEGRERKREIKRVCNGACAKLDQNACRERIASFCSSRVETCTTTREAQAVLLKEGDWEIWKLSPHQVLCEVLLKRMRMVAMQEKHKCFTILAAEEEEESAPPPSRFIASFFFASHNQPSSIASVCLSSAHPTRQAKQASNPSHHHPIVCVKTTAAAAAATVVEQIKLIIFFINKWIDHQPSPLSPC